MGDRALGHRRACMRHIRSCWGASDFARRVSTRGIRQCTLWLFLRCLALSHALCRSGICKGIHSGLRSRCGSRIWERRRRIARRRWPVDGQILVFGSVANFWPSRQERLRCGEALSTPQPARVAEGHRTTPLWRVGSSTRKATANHSDGLHIALVRLPFQLSRLLATRSTATPAVALHGPIRDKRINLTSSVQKMQ